MSGSRCAARRPNYEDVLMPLTTGLEGKVVLITGGSGGIGRAVASAMAAQGARLAICGRDEPRLQQIVDELRSGLRTDIISVKAKMTRLNDIRRFVGAAMSKFGRIDILEQRGRHACRRDIANVRRGPGVSHSAQAP